MGGIVKIVAIAFRVINLFFDVLQTWQYTGGGGVVGISIGGVLAWWQELSLGWTIFTIIIAVISASIVIALMVRLFTSGNIPSFEKRRLHNIAKLVYDIHKRTCAVRKKLIKKTDWSEVDKSKVMKPLMDISFGDNLDVAKLEITDDSVITMEKRLKEAGELMRGVPSVLNTYLKDSDSSLDKELDRDFWYKVLMARLENYKPYPNVMIRNDVQSACDTSFSFNNVIIYQMYSSDIHLAELLKNRTKISVTERAKIDVVNKNIEEIMNEEIDKRCSILLEHVEEYIYKRVKK